MEVITAPRKLTPAAAMNGVEYEFDGPDKLPVKQWLINDNKFVCHFIDDKALFYKKLIKY